MEPRHECPTSDGPHRHNTQYSVAYRDEDERNARRQAEHMTIGGTHDEMRERDDDAPPGDTRNGAKGEARRYERRSERRSDKQRSEAA